MSNDAKSASPPGFTRNSTLNSKLPYLPRMRRSIHNLSTPTLNCSCFNILILEYVCYSGRSVGPCKEKDSGSASLSLIRKYQCMWDCICWPKVMGGLNLFNKMSQLPVKASLHEHNSARIIKCDTSLRYMLYNGDPNSRDHDIQRKRSLDTT